MKFYENAGYYGSFLLSTHLTIPERTRLLDEVQTPDSLEPHQLLESTQEFIQANAGVQNPIALHPVTASHFKEYVEGVMNDLARMVGGILSPSFDMITASMIESALRRLRET